MKFQVLRGVSSALPILNEGELAFCLDTAQLWVGNGQENFLIGDPLALEKLKVVNAQLVEANREVVSQIEELKAKLENIGSSGGGGGQVTPPPGGKLDADTLQGRSPDEFAYLGIDSQLDQVPVPPMTLSYRTAAKTSSGIDADTLGGKAADEFVFIGNG